MSADDEHEVVIATKAWDSEVLRRLLRYVRPHTGKFVASFAVLIGLFGLQLVSPWLLHNAIDGPVAGAMAARDASEGGDFDAAPFLGSLAGWGLAYLAAVLLAGVMRYLEIAQLTRAGQSVIHDLRQHVFARIQTQDLSWFDRHPIGALVTRVTSDIENLNELFTSGLVVLLFDVVKIVVVLGLLFSVSPPIALLVLCLTPVLIGVSLVFRGGARRAHRTVRARLARMNGYLQEVLSGIRVVQVFRREERVSRRFAERLAGYLEANFRTIFLFGVFFPTVNVVTVGIQGASLWRGGGMIAAGTLRRPRALRERGLPLRHGPHRAGGHQLRDPGRPDRGPGGRHRLGQVHPGQPALALLRPQRGARHGGRGGPARDGPRSLP